MRERFPARPFVSSSLARVGQPLALSPDPAALNMKTLSIFSLFVDALYPAVGLLRRSTGATAECLAQVCETRKGKLAEVGKLKVRKEIRALM